MSNVDLTIDGVMQLLAMRSDYGIEDDCVGLEKLALDLEHGKTEHDIFAENPHLHECDMCAQTVRQFISMEASSEEALPPANVRRFSQKKVVYSITALAAALIMSVALFSWFQATPQEPASTLIAKGMAYDFQIAVSRGNTKFGLIPGETVQTGDALGFFYSAPKSGYLAVFFVDETKQVQALFPTRQRSAARIEKGVTLPIRDGAIVTPATHCEWIVAVFLDDSKSLDVVKKEIVSSMKMTAQCELQIGQINAANVNIQQIRGRE